MKSGKNLTKWQSWNQRSIHSEKTVPPLMLQYKHWARHNLQTALLAD
jgi:hypothetical protein